MNSELPLGEPLESEGTPWEPRGLEATGWEGESRYRNPADNHEYDRLGRRQPRRIPLGVFLGVAPFTAAERIRRVPAAAVAEEGEEDGEGFALVNCRCGAHPVARTNIAKCPGCERWYVFAGRGVYVVYGEMEIPPAPASRPGA